MITRSMAAAKQYSSGLDLLSDIVAYSKYSNWNAVLERRESWEGTVMRQVRMHMDNFPQVAMELASIIPEMLDRRVLGSMRMAQFAGDAVMLKPNRGYNCSYLPIIDVQCFGEVAYLLLGGSGVGFSVEHKNINKLPMIRGIDASAVPQFYMVQDTIEGWADAFVNLIRSYTERRPEQMYDYSQIRPKGSPLRTSGGIAPGHQDFAKSIEAIRTILSGARARRLKSIEVYDILCHIAECANAGGIRRSATICFFDSDDTLMLLSKQGPYYIHNPQRARSNNSIVLDLKTTTREEYNKIFDMIRENNTGEPGFFWTYSHLMRANPCVEIGLPPFGFCNLTTGNGAKIRNKADFLSMCYALSLLGTVQAAYTDFSYLRSEWQATAEETALLGCSISGIATNRIDASWISEGVELIANTNIGIAKKLGINSAERLTCIKPDGNSAALLGTSSGVHGWKAPMYVRRMRLDKTEPIYNYLKQVIPELLEDDVESSNRAVLSLPIYAPTARDGQQIIIESEEPALNLFERIKFWNTEWVRKGHQIGENYHNVSSTVALRPNEWDDAKEWLWDNRFSYHGITLMPHDDSAYRQAPFEIVDHTKFESMVSYLQDKKFRFSDIVESVNLTNLVGEAACAGGSCEIA